MKRLAFVLRFLRDNSVTTAIKFGLVAAAVAAAAVTALSTPSSTNAATPTAKSLAEATTACAQRTWPYLHCVGTSFGNPQVRLVTTDRLSP